MSNTYMPDRWIIVKIHQDGKSPWHRVLGSWYGGYLNGDSWRLSSGITKVVEHDKHYEIHNESGSVYTCYKSAVGTSSLSAGILNNWCNEAEQRDGVAITVIDVKELLS